MWGCLPSHAHYNQMKTGNAIKFKVNSRKAYFEPKRKKNEQNEQQQQQQQNKHKPKKFSKRYEPTKMKCRLRRKMTALSFKFNSFFEHFLWPYLKFLFFFGCAAWQSKQFGFNGCMILSYIFLRACKSFFLFGRCCSFVHWPWSGRERGPNFTFIRT